MMHNLCFNFQRTKQIVELIRSETKDVHETGREGIWLSCCASRLFNLSLSPSFNGEKPGGIMERLREIQMRGKSKYNI